jgi:hypothetical protein
MIYRSWRADDVRVLHPPASWPRELIAAIVEEVVADADETTWSLRVTEPGEVGASLAPVVLVGAGTRG